MRAAVLALALLCACAKDFDELAPFPCASLGHGCPAPFVCAEGQCVPAQTQACKLGEACAPPGFPGAAGRCTVLDTGVVPAGGRQYDDVTPFCVPLEGAGVLGRSCRLSAGPAAGTGFPDADRECGSGLVCFDAGWYLQFPAACSAYCGTATSGLGGCGAGQQCLGAFPASAANGLAQVGVCVPSCTLLGSDCTGGTCALAADVRSAGSGAPAWFGYCTMAGPIGEGGQCDPALSRWREQCAAGLTCWQTAASQPAVCSRVCRSTSECPASQKCCGPDQCATDFGFPAGIGVCGT